MMWIIVGWSKGEDMRFLSMIRAESVTAEISMGPGIFLFRISKVSFIFWDEFDEADVEAHQGSRMWVRSRFDRKHISSMDSDRKEYYSEKNDKGNLYSVNCCHVGGEKREITPLLSMSSTLTTRGHVGGERSRSRRVRAMEGGNEVRSMNARGFDPFIVTFRVSDPLDEILKTSS